MTAPAYKDILDALKRIRPYLRDTPLYSYPAVNDLIGTEVYIKHENYQPVGAFKVRGGINLIAQLSDEEKARGVIAVSTGNHGQSIAYASRLFGVKARIVVPVGANPGKVAAIRGMGAEVIFHGKNFDEALLHCEEITKTEGSRYVHAGDEPHLIAGVGTYTLEILDEVPDIDIIFIPVGGGSGSAGACLVVRGLNAKTEIIGVQSESSPAAYKSWKEGKPVEAPNNTIAEGLATGSGFSLPQKILREYLTDFMLVSDEEIMQAMVWMIEHAHTLAEAAGAAPLAASYKMKDTLQGKKIALICSGGNVSLEQLRKALQI
jgi:threonine dehydratase